MTEWLQLGTEVMRQARKTRGLSYEAVARLLHVSSKTYERWEKAGRVPRHEVGNVADALGLEIEEPERARLSLDGDPAVRQELAQIRFLLEQLFERLEGEVPPRDASEQP